MDYFWKQQDDIPAGMGYPLFGVAHICSVLVTLLVVAGLIALFKRLSDQGQKRFLKILPIIMVGMEVFKDLFLASVGRFGIGYLPLHICSVGIFVFLLQQYLPWKRAKEVFGEISFVLIMPASVAALIFPDWTVFYPVLNYMNINSYVWHGALVLFPLLLLIRGDIHPSIRHIHWNVLFLCVLVPPILAFDKHFGCNYLFVNWPLAGTPLEWCAEILGNPGYLVGYAVMVVAVMVVVYMGVRVIYKICWREG